MSHRATGLGGGGKPELGILLKVSAEWVLGQPERQTVMLLQTQLDALAASSLPIRSEELLSRFGTVEGVEPCEDFAAAAPCNYPTPFDESFRPGKQCSCWAFWSIFPTLGPRSGMPREAAQPRWHATRHRS
jgi:hypothetical protein